MDYSMWSKVPLLTWFQIIVYYYSSQCIQIYLYSIFNDGHCHEATLQKYFYPSWASERWEWQGNTSWDDMRKKPETYRGTRLKREPIFIWVTPERVIIKYFPSITLYYILKMQVRNLEIHSSFNMKPISLKWSAAHSQELKYCNFQHTQYYYCHCTCKSNWTETV